MEFSILNADKTYVQQFEIQRLTDVNSALQGLGKNVNNFSLSLCAVGFCNQSVSLLESEINLHHTAVM